MRPKRLRRLLTRACQLIGVKPTPENAAQIARGIMEGRGLVRSLCDAIADDEPTPDD